MPETPSCPNSSRRQRSTDSAKALTRRAAVTAMARTAFAGGAGLVLASEAAARMQSVVATATPHLPQRATILFQGDSITDGGRCNCTDPNHIFGQSYPYLISAFCGGHYPERGWTFLNRGVSGNKVTDLEARWQADTLDLKPDVLSILVGVNDAGSVAGGGNSGVTAEQFEQVYDALLQQTLAALPLVKFVFGEPFVLPVGKIKDQWEPWSAEVKKRQEVAARLAAKYRAPIVRYQKIFDAACKRAPADYWIWDGVHPTYAGHQLMADEWLRVVNATF